MVVVVVEEVDMDTLERMRMVLLALPRLRRPIPVIQIHHAETGAEHQPDHHRLHHHPEPEVQLVVATGMMMLTTLGRRIVLVHSDGVGAREEVDDDLGHGRGLLLLPRKMCMRHHKQIQTTRVGEAAPLRTDPHRVAPPIAAAQRRPPRLDIGVPHLLRRHHCRRRAMFLHIEGLLRIPKMKTNGACES